MIQEMGLINRDRQEKERRVRYMATKTKGPWNKENINELLQKSDQAVMKGLTVIYDRQTSDEQSAERTKYLNGRGFNGLDAEFGTSLAKQVITKNSLSPKQMLAARKMLGRYAGQLALVANEKAGTEVIPQVAKMNPALATYNPVLVPTNTAVELSYDASDLDGKCPGCKAKLVLSNGFKDGEGEFTHWVVKCGCGATYTVFND